MPPSKSPAPVYRYHVSGNAQVRLCGKDFYLGPHGSPESYSRYHALLAEYNANGMKLPEGVPQHQMSQEIRVRDVTADFREIELQRYVDNSGSYSRLSGVLNALDELYGDLAVSELGPLRLRELRNRLARTGNCRRYLNDQTRDVIRIVRHGLSRELVKPETITALESLRPLRRGEAPDNPKRGGVALSLVSATLPHVSPVVQTMIRLQLATGCRPSEIFRMTPAQIDRSGAEWMYRPVNHKTQHRGKTKVIPIVGEAVRLLEPLLFCDPEKLCFVTQKGTPWNKDSYRQHITRATEKHGLEHWTPYQLRHTVAQTVRDELGVEAAAALLGHSKLSTTEIYSRASEQRAIDAARIASSSATSG
jgi:integrase